MPKVAAKLHWRTLTDENKKGSLQVVSSMGVESIIVSAAPLPTNNPERARRKCLERLLVELDRQGVEMLHMESRTLRMDRKDIVIIKALRTMQAVTSIDLGHALPNDEPRLWVPDQILGAYGDIICNTSSTELWGESCKAIRQKTTVVELTT